MIKTNNMQILIKLILNQQKNNSKFDQIKPFKKNKNRLFKSKQLKQLKLIIEFIRKPVGKNLEIILEYRINSISLNIKQRKFEYKLWPYY